jgi:hypothetical protein
MANELNIARVAFANFAPTAAGDYTSDAIIPAGAIVKSITTVEGTALAGGTNITFKGGGISLTAAIVLADFTGVDVHALTSVDGLLTTASEPLSITSVGTHTGDIDVYVEYYFAEDHT